MSAHAGEELEDWLLERKYTQFCCLWLMVGLMMQVDQGIAFGIASAWHKCELPEYEMTMYIDEIGVRRVLPHNWMDL